MRTQKIRYVGLAMAGAVLLGASASGCAGTADRMPPEQGGWSQQAGEPRLDVKPMVDGEDGLRVGEYACYGFGGEVLIGLGFKVLSGNRYTDLDDRESGSYLVDGDTVRFRGGHLDDMEGRDLGSNGSFVLGQMATCEPW